MEWEAPAIVLDTRPYAEGDAVVAVMTEEHGVHRGLARGAQSQARAAVWQPGNLIQARWVGRLSEQLGSLSAEMIHPASALVMDDALALAMLRAACAVAEGALPEREPHARVFEGLLRLLARMPLADQLLAEQIRWEAGVLADLGYGLDLSTCAVTGNADDLVFVSPKSGRAVSRAAAGVWEQRLLALPAFMRDPSAPSGPEAWRDGLRLTGHFLARDAFGLHHKPLPQSRVALYDRVVNMSLAEGTQDG